MPSFQHLKAACLRKLLSPIHNLDEAKILTAKLLIEKMATKGIVRDLEEVEFKVFSQWGDDGIIQYLIRHVNLAQKNFIEFGVQNYTESNTRFLLMNNNWSGLILDGCSKNINYIKNDAIYWKFDLTASTAFIDKDNINSIIASHGLKGDIGILSVDIDGNDYYVWENIQVIQPAIVICEYNALFGFQHPISVPYDPLFQRTKAHYSNLYFGASLKALCYLAEQKEYVFVGCNSNGNNAFFVHKSRFGQLNIPTIETGYRESKFRESRDRNHQLTYMSGNQRLLAIQDLPVYDVIAKQTFKIKELF